MKATILKLAAINVESEIYMYRTKTCHYSVRKLSAAGVNKKNKKNKVTDKDHKDVTDRQVALSNPRKIFSSALDTIWTDLLASDISKGGLINPPSNADPLKDINDRIHKRYEAQNYYLGKHKSCALPVPGPVLPPFYIYAYAIYISITLYICL